MPVSKSSKKPTTKSTKTSTKKLIEEDEDDGGKKDKIKEISRQWYQNLSNEIQELKHTKMPAVVARIKEARSYWDLSENAEYDAAVEEKNMIESRVIEIETMLADSVIIDETISAATKKSDRIVRYGSNVTVESEEGEVTKFSIVSTGEVGFQSNIQHISFDSPVGAAIEGKKIWQTVKIRSERWRYDMKIIDIN